jgi:hypothetical protein
MPITAPNARHFANEFITGLSFSASAISARVHRFLR